MTNESPVMDESRPPRRARALRAASVVTTLVVLMVGIVTGYVAAAWGPEAGSDTLSQGMEILANIGLVAVGVIASMANRSSEQ